MVVEITCFQGYKIIGLRRVDVLNSFCTTFREIDIKYRDEANPDPTQKKKNEQEGKISLKLSSKPLF